MNGTSNLKTWLGKGGGDGNRGAVQKRPPPVNSRNEMEPKSKQPNLSNGHPPSASQNPPEFLSWVDKYKPTSVKQLIAQQGDKSPMNKLLHWLKNWEKLNLGARADEKKVKPPPWKTDDGSAFKAALLSGPPGIGKTSSAHMACQKQEYFLHIDFSELGLAFVEMNASDTRNKKQMDNTVAQLIGCRQIDEFCQNPSSRPGKVGSPKKQDNVTHVLIMDEVDGMSGNQDRAGMQELIAMIRRTKIPIICICNDRQAQKIRSLTNYCFDLRFPRPRLEQIRSRLMTISHLEKAKLPKEQIDEIIESSNHDVRQCIYNLQMVANGANQKDLKHKDVQVNIFEAARKLMSKESSLLDKAGLFFTDYSLMPLFLHENYMNITSRQQTGGSLGRLKALQKAADSISLGDITSRLIWTSGCWSLLNEMAMYSSALPSTYMNGHLGAMVQFPSWMGKNSTQNKRARLLHQLSTHTCLNVTASREALLTDYIPMWRDRLTRPLLENEQDGVREVIDIYDQYDMTREDSETVHELGLWPGRPDLAAKILPKVKAAVTRAFNKEKHLLPFASDLTVKKAKRKKLQDSADFLTSYEMGSEDVQVEDEDESSSDEEIAVVVKKKEKPKPTSTRGGGRGRGRGRGK